MPEWITGNWIWIVLGLGALWFVFRQGGMGCGMSGHDSHGRSDSARNGQVGESDEGRAAGHHGNVERPEGSAHATHRRGGCC